jgi:glycosyltransferase involved in cell wall biosynthesis
METTVPLVSVGLPVYNGAASIERALDSLLAQDFDDFEIVICDNASEDTTAKICAARAEQDSRIRFFVNPTNVGLVGNFNRTFELSRGTYFKWAAHDDWHAPDSLSTCVDLLQANLTAVACGTGVAMFDEDGSPVGEWVPPVDLDVPEPHRRFHRLIFMLGQPHLLFGMMRSSALARTRLMQSYLGSDRTLLAELSLLGPIVKTPDILHYYTLSSATRRGYPPSVVYSFANRDRLPLRTPRLIVKHLEIVKQSEVRPRHKLLMAGSVVGRFGMRDFRRLAAELYLCAKILATRAVRWRPRGRARPGQPGSIDSAALSSTKPSA